jgi:hypothetical protein
VLNVGHVLNPDLGLSTLATVLVLAVGCLPLLLLVPGAYLFDRARGHELVHDQSDETEDERSAR